MLNNSFHSPLEDKTSNTEKSSGNLLISLEKLFPGINTEGVPVLKPEKVYDFRDTNTYPPYNPMEIGLNYDVNILLSLFDGLPTREEIQDVFRRFKDQIVVDLGPGASGYGLRLAEISGAKASIEVEPFFSYQLLETIKSPTDKRPYPNTKKIPVAIIPEDALTLLKRLPDNSVSILASGLEEKIIHDYVYRTQLGEQITRVLSHTGMFVDWMSYLDLETSKLKEISHKAYYLLQQKIKI